MNWHDLPPMAGWTTWATHNGRTYFIIENPDPPSHWFAIWVEGELTEEQIGEDNDGREEHDITLGDVMLCRCGPRKIRGYRTWGDAKTAVEKFIESAESEATHEPK